MAEQSASGPALHCYECGFEAAAGEAWERVDHPTLGSITRCPECGTTNVHTTG